MKCLDPEDIDQRHSGKTIRHCLRLIITGLEFMPFSDMLTRPRIVHKVSALVDQPALGIIIGNYLIMRRLHDTSVVRLLLMRQDFLQTVPKITCVHSTGLLLKEFDSIKI